MQTKTIPAILSISTILPLAQAVPVRGASLDEKQNITDRIVSIKTRLGQGSGTIVKHVGNTYTVLTAAHVVKDIQNSEVAIITPDRQQHHTSTIEVKIAPNSIDLATVTFQSDLNYSVATLGDSSKISKGQNIIATGFLNSSLHFYPGTVVAISRQPQDRGYGIVIGNADILPGMSGGGLFTENGLLIGINGRSIGTVDVSANKQDRLNQFKPVSGLAIPIDTFTQVADRLQVDVDIPTSTPITTAPIADDFFISAGTKSQQGDYQGAVADYNRTLSLNPNFSEVYFRRGIARSLLRDWQGAVADYTQAIGVKPEHADAYVQRGSVRNILADWQGAKSDFNLALSLNPNTLSAYVGRGTALCELNDCQNSLRDYNRAIALNPTYAAAYSSRGLAYSRLGNKQSALSSYVAAAELYLKQGKDLDYLDTVKKIRELVKH
jgi:Flp pilus assembly protein TadD/S1-C subfamily serine protease